MPCIRRDYEVYLEDIRDAIGKVKRYTTGLTREAFENDDRTVDAVVRNLQIIGEAVKMIPESIRLAHANIEWKKIAGLRDILAHQYFGVDIEIIWDILENKLSGAGKRDQRHPLNVDHEEWLAWQSGEQANPNP